MNFENLSRCLEQGLPIMVSLPEGNFLCTVNNFNEGGDRNGQVEVTTWNGEKHTVDLSSVDLASFWNETHPLSEESDRLWNKYVPSSGSADNIAGELIRCIHRLGYEYFNNGNCNAISVETVEEYSTCSFCNGTGEITEDYGEDEEGNPLITQEVCPDCEGTGELYEEYDGEVTFSDYYGDMVSFIKYNTPSVFREAIEDFEKAAKDIDNNFSFENELAYMTLTELIVTYVSENEEELSQQEFQNYQYD